MIELITIALVVLKLCGVISMSWFIVFIPQVVAIMFYSFILFTAIRVQDDDYIENIINSRSKENGKN